MQKLRRSEIDVLRAISVLCVIIFHFDKNIFPLGYLGVDIFFVISGYLITKNILTNYRDNKFKFSTFYLNRIRRILPALLFVLITCLTVSIFILLTSDLNRFLESLLTSLGFFSNIYFWITGGYFSTSDELKPLLHLWSLSVEEQFYLFFPLFLIFIFKLFKNIKIQLFFIFLISVISFFINLVFIYKGHFDPIFFLFPARIWQFGLGAFFAFLPSLRIKNIYFDSIYLITSFLLIFFNFAKTLVFLPQATLMCVGTAMILYKSKNINNYLFNILNSKILIFIGLISYSLYLWHWPIISYLKYISIGNLTNTYIFLGILLTFFLSFLSWKFIEQPFIQKYSTKKVLVFVIFSYVTLLSLSSFIITNKNFPSRYDQYSNNLAEAIGTTYHCSIFDYIKFGYSYACLLNQGIKKKPEIVLFGNSHAHMYGWPVKQQLLKYKKQGITIPLNSCLPLIDKNISISCINKANQYFEAIIKDQNIKTVIIGLTWYVDELIDKENRTYKDSDFSLRMKSLNFLINELKKNNKTVYLIGPIETTQKEFASVLSREIAFKKEKSLSIFKSRKEFDKNYDKPIKFFSGNLKNFFLQPHKFICDKEKCYFADLNGSYFSDTNHLSYYGSMKMTNLFNFLK